MQQWHSISPEFGWQFEMNDFVLSGTIAYFSWLNPTSKLSSMENGGRTNRVDLDLDNLDLHSQDVYGHDT